MSFAFLGGRDDPGGFQDDPGRPLGQPPTHKSTEISSRNLVFFIFIINLSNMNGRVLVVRSHLEYYMITLTCLFSISLSTCVHIYIYIERERERNIQKTKESRR